jgi:hypothetical protein
MHMLKQLTANKQGKLIIALFSGLGNQMFHYAFYKYLSMAGFNVYLDKNSPQGKSQHQKHENYRLNYFTLKNVRYATDDDVLEFIPKKNEIYLQPFSMVMRAESVSTILKVFFYKLKNKLKLKRNNSNYWVEFEITGEGKDFYRKNLTKNTRAYMVGRYQEYYYMKNMREGLLTDFAFKQDMPKSVGMYYSEIIRNDSVSIHARRGDYTGAKEFDICSINYFRNAVNCISEIIENPVYYIFSDDLKWAKNNFNFLKNYAIVDNSQYENADYFDLYLMTNCKHNIIPNSTFSWWGAWLNQNPDKIVICPEKWNGLDLVYTDEICPPEWKRVDI